MLESGRKQRLAPNKKASFKTYMNADYFVNLD